MNMNTGNFDPHMFFHQIYSWEVSSGLFQSQKTPHPSFNDILVPRKDSHLGLHDLGKSYFGGLT